MQLKKGGKILTAILIACLVGTFIPNGVYADYINNSGQTIQTSRVVQGNTEDDFTETMPVATIFIDENVIYKAKESRNQSIGTIHYSPEEEGAGNPFKMGNATNYGGNNNVMLSFDTSIHPLSNTEDNYFDGTIFTSKFINGAGHIDPISGERTNYDVIIKYSNLHINVDSNSTGDTIGLFGGNAITLGHSGSYRYGVRMDIGIQIVDKAGNIVPGTFYFPMVDLDVDRSSQSNFANIYGAKETHGYYDQYANNYSEQVMVKSGLAQDKIWIPGAKGQNYKSKIEDTSDGLLVTATAAASGDSDTFYTGFATLADNTAGFSMTYWAATPAANMAGLETYLLTGKEHINHLIVSTTGQGGNIQTTRMGNHDGTLTDGYSTQQEIDENVELFGPSMLTVATGQTVVYTMTPRKGYRLKKVTVNRNSADITDAGTQEVRAVPVDSNKDGSTDYYTFQFSAISNNSSIHVEWEKTVLSITKNVVGSGAENDTFTFEISAWNPDNVSETVDFSEDPRFTSAGGGKYRFTLSSGQTINISSELIPAGWKWQAEEIQVNGKYGTLDGWVPAGTVQSGELPEDETTQDTIFTNKRKKVTDENKRITIKKIWEDDIPQIRPDNIDISIKRQVSGISLGTSVTGTPSLRSKMESAYGNQSTMRSQMTAFKYGTKAQAEAATGKVTITPDMGDKTPIYLWREGTELFFYSDAEVYLSGSMSQLFYGCRELVDISGLAHMKTTYVTSLFQTFYNCYKLEDLSPLADWDVSSVTRMDAVFRGSSRMALSDLSPLANWDTRNATRMNNMFYYTSVSDLSDIAGWDVGRVQNLSYMFTYTSAALVPQTAMAASWDPGMCTNFSGMFSLSNAGTAVTAALKDNLPVFAKRAGTWNDTGTTYSGYPTVHQSESDPAVPSDTESDFWATAEEVRTAKAHDVDDTDENIWIYEFEVPEGTSWKAWETLPLQYRGKYTVSGGKEGETLQDWTGIETEPVSGIRDKQTAVIKNKRISRQVILKITWEDDNDSFGIRPSAMKGSIDYKTGGYTGQLSTTDEWSINGNVWTKTFSIPAESSIPDWSQLLPSSYKMIAKNHEDGSNVYELVNSLGGLSLTVTKNVKGSLGDKTKNFSFTANFTGLAANKEYQAGEDTFTSDASGNASCTFTLKDDEQIKIDDLPRRSKVTVTESASDHTASLVKSSEEGNLGTLSNQGANESLSSGEITIVSDTRIDYTNTRGMAQNTGAGKRDFLLYAGVLIISVSAITLLVYRRKHIQKGVL